MHQEFFGWESVSTFNPSFWLILKLRLFGKRLDEHAGNGVVAVWYAYKGKLYMTKYDAF